MSEGWHSALFSAMLTFCRYLDTPIKREIPLAGYDGASPVSALDNGIVQPGPDQISALLAKLVDTF